MCKGSVHESIEAGYFPHEKDGSVQCTDRPAKSPAFAGIVVERARERRYSQRHVLERNRPLSNLFLD